MLLREQFGRAVRIVEVTLRGDGTAIGLGCGFGRSSSRNYVREKLQIGSSSCRNKFEELLKFAELLLVDEVVVEFVRVRVWSDFGSWWCRAEEIRRV